jgi:polyisoprenyl-teichoic acid--peptidoglycan teichoic acid transferase
MSAPTIERSSTRPRRSGDAVAALKSAVLPGWGQWGQGRHRSGMLFFRGLVVIATAVLALAAAGPTRLAEMLVRPPVFLALIVGYLVALGFWLFAIWDAWSEGGRRGTATGASVVMIVVAVPFLVFGWNYLVRPYQTLTRVFGGNSVEASPTTATPAGSGSVEPGSGAAAAPTTAPETTTTTVADPFAGKDRVNVLVLGGDAGPGRGGIRTDTMILASVGLEGGDVALFGFPRGLSGLTFPDGERFTAYQGIMNEVYPYGIDNPEKFPGSNPGAEAVMSMVEGLTGVEVDYYVMVNLQAFVEVVDALGGVTMYIPDAIVDEEYPKEDGTTVSIRIDQGVQELDGTEALAYVRSRRQSDDYSRMGRQRCFLTAVAAQADVASLIRGLPRLLTTIEQNVLTDIPLNQLPKFLELVGKVEATEAISLTFGPPDWISGYTASRFPIPDPAKIRPAVALMTSDPEQARITYGLEPAGEVCGYGDDPTSAPTTTTTTAATTDS